MDLPITYRWNVRMPDQKSTTTEFMEIKLPKHTEQIIEGKEQILISPVYGKYIQPIFDFDGRKNPTAAYDEAEYIYKLSGIPGCFEVTNTGVHLVLFVALRDTSVEELRIFFKRTRMKKLDVSSSFRDLVVFRCGSFREEGYTMLPTFSPKEIPTCRSRANNIPSSIYSAEKWTSIWRKCLFPRKLMGAKYFYKKLEGI